MKIQCQDRQLIDIFKSDYLEIPRFQRPYSWMEEQWEEFWSDVFERESEDYFIGSMVVYKKGEYKAIVDGQQRLTTSTIILAKLRDFYTNWGLNSLAEGIQNLIERNDINNDPQFVLRTEGSSSYMELMVQSKKRKDYRGDPDDGEELIKDAVIFFEKQIEASIGGVSNSDLANHRKKDKIKRIINNLRDRLLNLRVIYIELDCEDDACFVFETLNTRGKDLETSDLVKNHLSRLLPEKNKRSDEFKLKWKEVVDNIEKINSPNVKVDDFVYTCCLLSVDTIKRKNIFKQVKKSINNKNKANKFLVDLCNYSLVYRLAYCPEHKDWGKEENDVKCILDLINHFGSKQPVVLIMVVLYKYVDRNNALPKKEILQILSLIELYLFSSFLSKTKQSGGVIAMFAGHAKRILPLNEKTRRHKEIDAITKKIKEKFPSRQEFVERFNLLKYSRNNQKNKKQIQYVLSRLSVIDGGEAIFNFKQMSIEHIAPEGRGGSWSCVSDECVSSIGNLLFIGRELNSGLNNSNFNNKISEYRKRGVCINGILGEVDQWGAGEIGKRAEEMANKYFDYAESVFQKRFHHGRG